MQAQAAANGGSSTKEPVNGAVVDRNKRRMEWWKNNKKNAQVKKSDTNEHEKNGDNQRTKLRNRESIPKPEGLKYEHNLNKGFHSKVIENLYINSPKKKKKKGGGAETKDTSPRSAVKRKASGAQPTAPSPKKSQAEPEVFDSYKFSMKLINGEVDVKSDAAGKESKNKYVLFIGNLPFDITREQLEEHFRKTGGIKNIRIPREKATDKGRGFAYMEFDGRISHGIALRLHQTTLAGRKINVEFTSIGGGKSTARKEKLKMKNRKRKKMKMQ